MSFICRYCGKQCKNANSLAQHEVRCKLNPNHINLVANSDLDQIPEEQQRLLFHYMNLYPEEYKQIYRDIQVFYLSEGYKKYDAAKLAKKDTLSKLIELDEPLQIAKGVWSCPICKLHIKDMGSHVKRVHNINWQDFKQKYNWNGSQIFCDETHRKNLSENKKHFYNETISGEDLRRLQSAKMQGESNPAHSEEVKLKISKSRTGQHLSSTGKYKISKSTNGGLYSENAMSFGYTFWAMHNGKELRFRSKTEYLIFLMLKYYNIPFEYEPYKIEYFDDAVEYLRHYIVDFVSQGRLFEVKPSELDFSTDRKYLCIQRQLQKMNKKLEVLTPVTFYNIFNIEEDLIKPLSYFDKIIIENIRSGECKMRVPIMHDESFYYSSSFMRQLGTNPKEVLEEGGLLYENKKNSGNNQ